MNLGLDWVNIFPILVTLHRKCLLSVVNVAASRLFQFDIFMRFGFNATYRGELIDIQQTRKKSLKMKKKQTTFLLFSFTGFTCVDISFRIFSRPARHGTTRHDATQRDTTRRDTT
jgi:hypothetical protein